MVTSAALMRPAPFPKDKRRAPTGLDALQYWLLVCDEQGESDEGYENDGKIVQGGAPLLKGVLVMINESPVCHMMDLGQFVRISEWLYEGKNEISLSPAEEESEFYVKVFELRQKDFCPPHWLFERVVAKTKVKPGQRTVLRFNASIDYDPFFDELPTDEKGREELAKELREYVRALLEATRARDYEAYERIALAPYEDRPHWGVTREEWVERRQGLKAIVENDEYERIATSADEFDFFFGRLCVLAYSGYSKGDIYSFDDRGYYAERMRSTEDGSLGYVEPYRLVRVSGQWEVW